MKPTDSKTDSKPEISIALIRAADRPRMQPCSLAAFVTTLKPAEMAAIFAALADQSIRGHAIHQVLVDRGFKHDRQVVWRHRGKPCLRCQALGLKVP